MDGGLDATINEGGEFTFPQPHHVSLSVGCAPPLPLLCYAPTPITPQIRLHDVPQGVTAPV